MWVNYKKKHLFWLLSKKSKVEVLHPVKTLMLMESQGGTEHPMMKERVCVCPGFPMFFKSQVFNHVSLSLPFLCKLGFGLKASSLNSVVGFSFPPSQYLTVGFKVSSFWSSKLFSNHNMCCS